MALANEGNTDLAFDTVVLREYGNRYVKIAEDLETMSESLDNCLLQLKESGWTTPAGTAFYEMTTTKWKDNIKKYADLLRTLNDILVHASNKYDNLVIDYIEKTQV